MEHNGVEFTVVLCYGENCGNHIVQCVGLNGELATWYEVPKDRGGSKCFLESFESITTLLVEVPGVSFRVKRFSGETISE